MTGHLRMTASCIYLWIFRCGSDHLFYRVPLGNLFQVQVARFQPPDTGTRYFTSAFQACYTRTKSSYSKARSSHQKCSIKKGILRIFVTFTGKHLRQSLLLIKLQGSGLETPVQVFLCEFYKISENNFFTEHLRATTSGKHSFT